MACILCFAAAHLPFLASFTEDIDSVNFVLGVHDFDVSRHQPHPPGYPAFIALGKLGAFMFGGGTSLASAARGLALVGVVFGALTAWPLFFLLRVIEGRDDVALAATALTLSSPLFWFSAARPMSDVPGLAVALAAMALLAVALVRQQKAAREAAIEHRAIRAADLAASGRPLVLGALVAGLAVGMRSQTAWLTLPLLALVLIDRTGRGAAGAWLGSAMTFGLGVIAWLVPLLVASGGPRRYLDALGAQGAEDFAGVDMLWRNPTPRRLLDGLLDTFVEPWASSALAIVVLAAATAGVVAVIRGRRRAAYVMAVAAIPYAVFHLLFHETFTTRYALPLVPLVAYLAARGLAVPGPLVLRAGAAGLVAASLALTAPALAAYAELGSPLGRAVADVREALRRHDAGSRALMMDLPFAIALRQEAFAADRIPTVKNGQWLQLARYWERGGSSPVWYLAEPGPDGLDRRHELALVDPAAKRLRQAYRWPFDEARFLGGVRPSTVDWYEVTDPGWFALEGWALTPQTAGVARRDGRGPAQGGATALVRRRPGAATLMIGGRNLGAAGTTDVRFSVSIDGVESDQWVVAPAPGFFLRWVDLPPGSLAGEGRHAQLVVRAEPADRSGAAVDAAVEQFDLQDAGALAWGYGDGWHELEYSPRTGRHWRWTSAQAIIQLAGAVSDLRVVVRGRSPLEDFDAPPEVQLSAAGDVLGRWSPDDDFTWTVMVPARSWQESAGRLVLRTSRVFVPRDRLGGGDGRSLGLRIEDVRVTRLHAGSR